VTQWSSVLLGEHLRGQGWVISDSSVRRILEDADLKPHRQKILSAKVLARGSFASLDELRKAVYDFLLWFNAQNKPPFNSTGPTGPSRGGRPDGVGSRTLSSTALDRSRAHG
jgi:hypothetical protein